MRRLSVSKKKEPKITNKNRDDAINTLIGNQNWFRNQLEVFTRLFDAYLGYKGDTEEYTKHLEKLKADFEKSQKEASNDKEGDAKSDEKVVEQSSAS